MNSQIATALVVFLSFTTSVALANDAVTKFKCYGTPVILYNSNIVESPFFVLTIENPGHPNFHTFPVTEEFLDVRCEKDKNGKDFLLVNHFCGGSRCAESNYALIDLSTGKEVLKASETMLGNANRAESILGKPLIPFSCKERSKSSSKSNDRGEFCLVSPIELY
jgi:hypothetical protein